MEPVHYKLLEAWFEHCREVGHTPKSEGGNATCDLLPSGHCIYCSTLDCNWKYRSEPDVDK